MKKKNPEKMDESYEKFLEDKIVGMIERRIEPKMTKSGIEISGHALYALTSLMSHSCISNSKTIIKSDYSCECRATTLIPAGEEITKQVSSV